LTAFRALPHVHLRHLAALPDLKGQPGAAVLVTGAGFAYYDAQIDTMAVQWNAMGTALSKAAQHKVVGLLGEKLKGGRRLRRRSGRHGRRRREEIMHKR
jgi:hypothetical protein